MASSHESEGPVTAVIIQEVISDCVVELNPATMDSSTDQAEVSVVSDVNGSHTHLENLDGHTSSFGIRQWIPLF